VNSNWTIAKIEEIAEVNPRLGKAGIPDDLPVSFVPMPAVGAGDGSIDVSQVRQFGEVRKGFTSFQQGDVLFAKITPCMENGKMAVVPKVQNGFGFGSTEFHVLRPKPGIDARYLYYYVSSRRFRGEAEHQMSGAVGQKRVPTQYLRECTIPLAPLNQQTRIIAEIEKQFSRLDEAVANLKRYKAAVLKAAVEGKLTEEWRRRGGIYPTQSEGRDDQGAMNQGAMNQGAMNQGAMNQGAMNQGAMNQGAMNRAPTEPTETGVELLERILAERRANWQGRGKYKEPAGPDTSGLPELPVGWVWASLGSLPVDVFGGPFGSNLKSSDYVPSDVRVIRLENIGSREFFDGKESFVTSSVRLENCIHPESQIMVNIFAS
jgi:type I restriction enzyme S subunit